MEAGKTSHLRVAVLPPLIISIPFAVGLALQWLVPIRFPPRVAGLVLGVPRLQGSCPPVVVKKGLRKECT